MSTRLPLLFLLAAALLVERGHASRCEAWAGWPVFVWRLEHEGRELPEELLAPFGGTNVEGDEEAPWVLERGLDFYVGRAAGWSELHLERDFPWYAALFERWYETREASLLVREPCLSDPATRERLSAELERTLAARGGQSGLFLLLGDEVGLTPAGDPLDLCHAPHCLALWKRFARERLGFAEGREPALPDTDVVRRAWAEGDASGLGLWLTCRRFQRERMTALLADLAREARAKAPAARLGLTGLVGPTAFGGVAFDLLLEELDVLEAYPVVEARELLLTLRTSQRALATVVLPEGEAARAAGAADAAAWAISEHWLRGEDALVLWSDRSLKEPLLAARVSEALSLVRRLERELAGSRPRPAGLAVLHDADATALSFLKDALLDGPTWPRRFAGWQAEHGTRERSLGAWLRLAEDVGLFPGALPCARLGKDTAVRFPLLVAAHQLVLDDADLARLAAFLEAGGTLLVEGPLGVFDRAGRPREDCFASLAERFEERVLRAPSALEEYLRVRLRAGDGRAEGARATLRSLLDARRLARAPRASDGTPWLVTTRPGPGAGERTSVALPGLFEEATRAARLAPLELVLEPPPARWLYPPADAEGRRILRPGEPAVWVEREP